MNIEEAIKYGVSNLKGKENSRNLSMRLLENLLNKDKQYLVINNQEELEESVKKKYIEEIEKLKNGKPLQYIIKKQSFMNLEFYVDENVLIPQPDTEILAEEAINIIKEKNFKNILDLCTGSGAIGISIAKYIKDIKVTMSDISDKAILIAKKNAEINNVYDKCEFINSDLFKNINKKYDIILSNPPYIESNAINRLSKEVQNEPILALDGGKDGLKFYKNILSEASKYLNDSGYLLLEIGYDQKEKIEELLGKIDNLEIKCFKKDLQGIFRVVVIKKRKD